jgi:hypothetical protein
MLSGASVAALLVGFLLAGDVLVVQAFCRETVESPVSGPCVETAGVPRLVWKRSCLTYVFNDLLFQRMPMLTEAEIRSIFATSFATWRAVRCSGASGGFWVEQAAGTTSHASGEVVLDERNESIIVARTQQEWLEREHAEGIVALTLLWSNSKTGEIVDVDMEINTGTFMFANCDATTCSHGMIDLQNTITHEAGHLLGLGHSPVADSTMFDDTKFGQTGKRTLAPDDIAGYCALELPKFECTGKACKCPPPPIFATRTSSSGCAVSRPLGSHASTPLALVPMLALITLVVRRENLTRRELARRDRALRQAPEAAQQHQTRDAKRPRITVSKQRAGRVALGRVARVFSRRSRPWSARGGPSARPAARD